jgi:hypothetical protein
VAYTFTGEKYGEIRFEPDENGIINRESESFTSRVTSNPVENGADINDHVINDAQRLSINGVIIGGDDAKAALLNMRDKCDIVTYTGRTRVSSLVFTSLSFDYSARNKDGNTFRATLQKIDIISAQVTDVGAVPMTTQDAGKASTSQANKTANAGTQTTVIQPISSSSYANYSDAYRGGSSPGPSSRQTPSYNGVR